MSRLLQYRPWNFRDGNASQIMALTQPERKSDDRSPFVRYARSAALWAEWVREEVVAIDPEPQMPSETVDGYSFRLAVMSVDSLVGTISVPPSAKDHQQRLLESTQLYVEPIVVIATGDDSFRVVGNHELYAATLAYQEELSRPNRVRPSDYCLVALADRSYLSTIQTVPLAFLASESTQDIVQKLQGSGYAVSPRADDPTSIALEVDGQILTKSIESGASWKAELAEVLGLRSLDQGSNISDVLVPSDKEKITLTMPKLVLADQKTGIEFPYGSLDANIKPVPGANMWSLRDFRVE